MNGIDFKLGRQALGALLALALPFGLAACSRGETDERKTSTDTARIERQSLEIRAEASGQIEPLRVVEVKSRVGGELRRITIETGNEVPHGAVIAEIDPRDVKNALDQAEADMELARARVVTAEAQRRRAEELSKAGVMSAQDLETKQLDETNAKAQLLKAQTNLDLAREKMGDVAIRSPISGTVIEKTVEQGQIIASASGNVSGGTTLVKMADLSIVQARALVDETDIGRVHAGQPAQITVEAYPGRTFRGSVAKIEPQAVVEQNVTMFPVLVRLENPERLLRPGMNAEVSIEIADRENVIAVPNQAVVGLREAASAGTALGLDEQQVRSALAKMREEGQARRAAGPGRSEGQQPRGDDPPGGGERRRWNGGGPSGPGGGPGGSGGDMVSAGLRPGVVFVKTPKGPAPRFVLLGLSDWDYTEVVRGLEPGAEVYLISVARLQQQQEQFANRMRERAGGGMFGSGQQRSGSGGPGGGAPGGSSGRGGR
ncbi:MAG TPA: efflux RND transporter periplasmic adaptor subunit [Thermoanaerobaculia bacterium]|nr:efflux RND transporter periplasmic adaptor subunit [Thermoanaerobaculia bacterium]